ncbi:MAG TPA: GGDEF domain-containing protein, partial [bacterium]|nr:GGDEF domain-containing protein [bacterium]
GNFIYFYEIRKYPIISKPNKEIGIAWYIRDVTEQYKLSAQLKSYAEKDELTGIWNRRKWVEMARMEIIRTQRYRRPFTVMSIDIDYFKKVNDTLGHEAGDKALISITDTISSKIRNIDIFGRIGGEEFAIIFPEIGREEAYTVANRLLAGVSDNKIHINGKELSVTISIGITTYDGSSDMTLEELIRKADNAMYEAKRTGRNKVCFAA